MATHWYFIIGIVVFSIAMGSIGNQIDNIHDILQEINEKMGEKFDPYSHYDDEDENES